MFFTKMVKSLTILVGSPAAKGCDIHGGKNLIAPVPASLIKQYIRENAAKR
jgi:hypothetical protein